MPLCPNPHSSATAAEWFWNSAFAETAAFPMKIRNVCLAPARSLWIALRFQRFAPRIRSTICRRHSPDRKFVCVLFSCTICRSKPRTNNSGCKKRRENRPPTSCGQPAGRSGGTAQPRLAKPFSMTTFSNDPPLLAIVGPTASGKSALGVFLARQFGGEVVACDSTQLYRGFDVGTAKPASAERSSVAHHLLDVLDAAEGSTAS